MAGTSLTFTPNKSTVYISASAAGYADPTVTVPGYVGVELRDITAGTPGTVIVGSGSLCISIKGTSSTTSWTNSMVTAYTVTPGTPVTVALYWQVSWADGNNHTANCGASTDPESNRRIVVFE
jgi:hypothetical protein